MITSLAANGQNDIYINLEGNLEVATFNDAVLTASKQAMLAQRGEMLYNVNLGMPNKEVTFVGNPSVVQFETAGRLQIQRIAGVVLVKDFTARVADNAMGYTADIETIYGRGVING